MLYPDVERVSQIAPNSALLVVLLIIPHCMAQIREVSMTIAVGVIKAAQRLGVDRAEDLRNKSDSELLQVVQNRMYHPLLDLQK